MELSSRIDQVMSSSEALRINAAKQSERVSAQFSSDLETALQYENEGTINEIVQPVSKDATADEQVPSWVAPGYSFDPTAPRKPNMREFMQALSNTTVEKLLNDPNPEYQQITRLASELLYGVVGSNEDTRDWSMIMGSGDIVKAARQATAEMYAPFVDVVLIKDDAGSLTQQIATINDADGNILRSLTGGVDYVRETLENFGATSASIPEDLTSRIVVDDFSDTILDALVNFKSQYEGEALAMVADPDAASSTADFLSDRASA